MNNTDAAIAAAVAGAGLARVLSYQIGPQVQAGSLEIVLEKHEPAAIPVSVVFPAGRRSTARVREFVEFAVERLKKARWLA